MRETFDVSGSLNAIRAQVVDRIEKHVNNPQAVGDRMAYTAAAAEIYLGWVPRTGQRHAEKVQVAITTMEREVGKLDMLRNSGFDITGERMYVRGKSVLEMCRRSLADPPGFLWGRGEDTLRKYIEDMDRRGLKGNGRSVADVRRHLGMPSPTSSGTP